MTVSRLAVCQASIPACNFSRCRLMRVKHVLERSGKLLTMVAAVFYDLVSAHICSGVLANSVLSVMLYTLFADRRPPSPRATAALMVRTTMSKVSRAESNSISPFGWTRKPAGWSLFCFDICIFSMERFIFRSRETRRSGARGELGGCDFFERFADCAVEGAENFLLRTPRQQVGQFPRQIQKPVARDPKAVFDESLNRRERHQSAGLQCVLALLSAPFCCDKARALLNEPAAAIGATCSHLAQVPDELLAHFIEIVSTALGLGDGATRKQFAVSLRTDEAMGRGLIKTCHFVVLRTSS